MECDWYGWKNSFCSLTERGERTRIISARRATKDEEREYYDGYEFR